MLYTHRDVSAGNVMIRVNAVYNSDSGQVEVSEWRSLRENKAQGFISDFELASIGSEDPAFSEERTVSMNKSARGDGITVSATHVSIPSSAPLFYGFLTTIPSSTENGGIHGY